MKRKVFMLLLAVTVLLPLGLRAQVTIGGTGDPQAGAILDLNSTVKGGLILSNVAIDDLTKIPDTGFVGITSAQETNEALAGTIVYNTYENAEKKIKKGLYVWDGEDWQSISGSTVEAPAGDPTCAAIQNVILTAKSSTLIIGSSGSVDLNVLSDGTNKFSGSETLKTYEWWRTDKNGANYAAVDLPTNYDVATYAMDFPEAGTYKVKVIADNCASSAQTSNEITVAVVTSLSTNGSYNILGVKCYDIALSGNNVDNRTNDFAGSFVKPYSFKYDNSFTNLSYTVLSDPSSIVSALSVPDATSGSGTGTIAINVTFNSNVRTMVGVGGSATVRIAASYTDNTGADKVAYIDVKVQDNTCCDGAIISGGAFNYASGYPANNGSFAGDGAKAGGASGTTGVNWSPDLNMDQGATSSTALNTWFTAANQDLCVYKRNYKSSGETNGTTTWANAVNNCANGTYADGDATAGWYLPNERELLYLYNALGGTTGSAIDFSNLTSPNYIATTAENMRSAGYWSSTEHSNPAFANNFYFNNSGRGNNAKSDPNSVRCVRRI